MKATAIFMACGTTLAVMGLVILRGSIVRAATSGDEFGRMGLARDSSVPVISNGQEDDFSPDAFRDELLK